MRRSTDPGRLPPVEGAHLLGGRYALLDRLGIGGMAVVWRAHDEVLGRTVAVKLLAGKHASEPGARDRIRAEARAAAALSHPNIAQVHDYGEAQVQGASVPYVVMELVRGGTLQQRMANGPLSPRYAMRVAAEVAAALAEAHNDGLVHRDIKPANVMVTANGAKVVDFGIAAAIDPGGSGDPESEVLGTPAYLAPERLTGDGVQPASDVYALGVLLYRMLSGHSPWSADTTTQMLTAHIYIDPEPLPPLPGVPDYVTVLCNRCLSKDPTERPSAREAAALLAQGAGLRVVEDALPAGPAGIAEAEDDEPSVLIRPAGLAATADAGPVPAAIFTPGIAAGSVAGAMPGPGDATAGARSVPGGPGHRTTPASPDSGDGATPAPAADRDAGTTDPGRGSAAVGAETAAGAQAAGKRRRRLIPVLAAVIVLALAGLLWWLNNPADQDGSQSTVGAPVDGGAAVSPATDSAPSGRGGQSASAGSRPSGKTAAPPRSPAGRPGRTPGVPPTAGGAPATTDPAGPDDDRTPTTTAPTPDDPDPVVRTFTSSAGSVEATCPSASTAQLLSWSPIGEFKVKRVEQGPRAKALAVFKHGKIRVRMTVTCSDGVPSNTSTDEE